MPGQAQFSEIREMIAGRMSDAIEMAPFAGCSPKQMEYCRRISAYLGLSVETIVSIPRSGAIKAKEYRLDQRRVFATARPCVSDNGRRMAILRAEQTPLALGEV
jgi:hypothetical protein